MYHIGMPNNLDFEVERLKEELRQETNRRDAAERSVRDSERDLSELQANLVNEHNVNANNNNWKLKYEKQREKNSYLEQELSLMKEKLEALSKTIAESPTSKKTNQPDLDLRLLLRQLEHEKCVLEGKVKDTEWRLDSESKELFKLSEKKREYMLKLNQSLQSPPFLSNKKKSGYHGIPDNQRIIDPRKGPIKKQACVNLPKISKDEVDAVLSANKKYNKRGKLSKKKKLSQEMINPDVIESNDHIATNPSVEEKSANENNIIQNMPNIASAQSFNNTEKNTVTSVGKNITQTENENVSHIDGNNTSRDIPMEEDKMIDKDSNLQISAPDNDEVNVLSNS